MRWESLEAQVELKSNVIWLMTSQEHSVAVLKTRSRQKWAFLTLQDRYNGGLGLGGGSGKW